MSRKRDGIEAYSEVRDQQIKEVTSPENLIKLLFDKACVLLIACNEQLAKNEDESFQKTSLHALQIVLSLRFVLKTEEGDEFSKSLFETYTSIAASLFKAREEKDATALAKIYNAMDELREAWSLLLARDN